MKKIFIVVRRNIRKHGVGNPSEFTGYWLSDSYEEQGHAVWMAKEVGGDVFEMTEDELDGVDDAYHMNWEDIPGVRVWPAAW